MANDPPTSWPEKGAIKFTDAELAYREGLPLVLKGISLSIEPGEKVGLRAREFKNMILTLVYIGRGGWSDGCRQKLVDPGTFPVCRVVQVTTFTI